MSARIPIAEVVAVLWCLTLALPSQAAASDRPDFSAIWQINDELSDDPHEKASFRRVYELAEVEAVDE